MRLDQFVSQSTGLSRNMVRRAIRNRQVAVAGQTITRSAVHIDPNALVTLDNQCIGLPGALYIMLHKPAGVVSATEDATQPTVLGLIDHPHRHTLHIVGRLDKDTTGLLFLTNDGDWSHRMTSPRHHVPKTYLATLAEPLSVSAIQQLQGGVMLRAEKQPTRPALIETLPQNQARITLHEGKYHQVKRMFAAVGNRVTALHREQIGRWALPNDLTVGEWQTMGNISKS